jgi:GNAT superfamily N-acetyltransferase
MSDLVLEGGFGVLGFKPFAIKIREVTGQLPIFPKTYPLPEEVRYPKFESENYKKGRWFYVEIHVGNNGIYGPAALGVVHVQDFGASMLSVYVLEPVRRLGFGRLLIEVAGARWPNLNWNDTDESRPFHRRLCSEGIAQSDGEGFYKFIPKSKRT